MQPSSGTHSPVSPLDTFVVAPQPGIALAEVGSHVGSNPMLTDEEMKMFAEDIITFDDMDWDQPVRSA